MLRFALAMVVLCSCLFSSSANAQVMRKSVATVRNIAQCVGGNCQARSTGFFVVGQRDYQGHVITSVGPVVDPVPSMAPALPAEPFPKVLESASVERSIAVSASARDFRSALLKAARQERGGTITIGEYFAIFVGSLNAQKLEQAKLAVADSAIQDGVLPAGQSISAIDWEKLIELIIKYLPMILDLFKN